MPPSARIAGSAPSASASGSAIGVGLTKTNGPNVSTDTGTSPSASRSKPGSRSARGALRSDPSSAYVHAWYGHWIVSRRASPSQSTWPRWRQTLTKPRSSPSRPRARTTGFGPGRGQLPRLGDLVESRGVLPRAAEQALLLEAEDGGIRVPVVRQRPRQAGGRHRANQMIGAARASRPRGEIPLLQLGERPSATMRPPSIHTRACRSGRAAGDRGRRHDDPPAATISCARPPRPRGTRGRGLCTSSSSSTSVQGRSAAAKPSRAHPPASSSRRGSRTRPRGRCRRTSSSGPLPRRVRPARRRGDASRGRSGRHQARPTDRSDAIRRHRHLARSATRRLRALQERRLAGAARAEQPDRLARLRVEGHVPQAPRLGPTAPEPGEVRRHHPLVAVELEPDAERLRDPRRHSSSTIFASWRCSDWYRGAPRTRPSR